MRFFGGLLIAIGLISAALFFLNMNFIFLKWINRWGDMTGWIIRGGIVLIGLVLYILGKPPEEE